MTKILETKTKEIYEIDTKGKSQCKLRCPACDLTNKDKREKSLSWNDDLGTGHCFRPSCDARFVKYDESRVYEKKEYRLPDPLDDIKPYSERMAAFFMSRGLFESTMKRFNIVEKEHFFPAVGEKRNAILFPYYRDKHLVNIKYRDGEKNFMLETGAELIPFNLDNIKGKKEIIITEGEFDCMAVEQVGFSHVISVPNGASLGNNRMDWLDNTIEYFEDAEKIILATDRDSAGINLRTQLAARLGIERCYKVEFDDCKDANEVLMKHGAERLKEIIKAAELFPIEGAFSVVDIENELDYLYENGLQKGYTIGMPDFDNLISFELGRFHVVTGIPSHGKSKVVDFVITRLNVLYNMKVAFFSPETYPIELHVSAISELLIGKKFGRQTMAIDEYSLAKNYINDNFSWIMPDDGFSVDNILNKARQLILRRGVQIIVIDPYNKLEHQIAKGENETQYISKLLDKLINFAHKNNIMLFLVAHPTKMKRKENNKYEVPTLYDINGSANFYNKTDFGFTIYRDFDANYVTAYINKVKFKHLGQTGTCDMRYNIDNNRFSQYNVDGGTCVHDYTNWIKEGITPMERIEKSGSMDYCEDTPF